MARTPKTIPDNPDDSASGGPEAEPDSAPDSVNPPDPIVESIEDIGEPSGGNFA